MPSRNPGPFEPIIYLIQTPAFFRIVGVGGLVMFTIVFLVKAAAHSFGAFTIGFGLFATMWIESSLTVCRRCRHFGTWHCGGQAKIVARLFTPLPSGINESRAMLHLGLLALYLIYGLYWTWHGVATGILFTLWAVLFVISAIPVNGFSWKAVSRPSHAA